MKNICLLEQNFFPQISEVGGKAMSLARMIRAKFNVPESWCVLTNAFDEFIETNHLAEKIQMELSRKDLTDCRWEELWDIALRIRNLIIKSEFGPSFDLELGNWYDRHGQGRTLAARSSSTLEDSQAHSFAGLHDSFIGITSLTELKQKIRLVWASLWSDAVLSYRKELSLQFSSKMAVIIQPLINGRVSGICFSQNPLNNDQMVIEAVYGMNQGLVDGKIEPDRWFLKRDDSHTISFNSSSRREKLVFDETLCLKKTEPQEFEQPALSDSEIKLIFDLGMAAENFYHQPQDVEWTIRDHELFLLQSRPVTTSERPDPKKDRKAWDLTLKRSFNNLCELNAKIDSYLLTMEKEGKALLETTFSGLSDDQLVEEFEQRKIQLAKWTDIYWEVFIPFGHGMRLFGQIYNEVIAPDDPYEFVTLLQVEKNIAKKRNLELQKLSRIINQNPEMKAAIASNDFSGLSRTFMDQIGNLVKNFAMPSQLLLLNPGDDFTSNFLKFVVKMPENHDKVSNDILPTIAELENRFLSHFPREKEREWAKDLLRIGRRSFLLRDDDNVFLNRFKEALEICLSEIKKRSENRQSSNSNKNNHPLTQILLDQQKSSKNQKSFSNNAASATTKKRQMVGQPASPGYSTGKARIIVRPEEIFEFKQGEIMICDAIGPELTFAVPLAAGIVERRGGMLIHGAIIAREYKIPCVTGISDATTLIKTGDKVAIDGHLGLVTILQQ